MDGDIIDDDALFEALEELEDENLENQSPDDGGDGNIDNEEERQKLREENEILKRRLKELEAAIASTSSNVHHGTSTVENGKDASDQKLVAAKAERKSAVVSEPRPALQSKSAPRVSNMTAEQEAEYERKLAAMRAANPPKSNSDDHDKWSRLYLSSRAISPHVLDETMATRQPVRLDRLAAFINMRKESASEDFIVLAVLAEKGPIKENRNVRLAVNRAVIDHLESEKIGVGAVVMMLNPEPWLSMRDQSVNLSMNHATAIKMIGMARDYGTCMGKTKQGDKCRSIVNTAKCKYCMYHAKQGVKEAAIRNPRINNVASRELATVGGRKKEQAGVFYVGSRAPKTAAQSVCRMRSSEGTAPLQPKRSIAADVALKDLNNEFVVLPETEEKPFLTVVEEIARSKPEDDDIKTIIKKSKHGAQHLIAQGQVDVKVEGGHASMHLVRAFGRDPITNKTEREIKALDQNASGGSAASVLIRSTTVGGFLDLSPEKSVGKAKAEKGELFDISPEKSASQRKRPISPAGVSGAGSSALATRKRVCEGGRTVNADTQPAKARDEVRAKANSHSASRPGDVQSGPQKPASGAAAGLELGAQQRSACDQSIGQPPTEARKRDLESSEQGRCVKKKLVRGPASKTPDDTITTMKVPKIVGRSDQPTDNPSTLGEWNAPIASQHVKEFQRSDSPAGEERKAAAQGDNVGFLSDGDDAQYLDDILLDMDLDMLDADDDDIAEEASITRKGAAQANLADKGDWPEISGSDYKPRLEEKRHSNSGRECHRPDTSATVPPQRQANAGGANKPMQPGQPKNGDCERRTIQIAERPIANEIRGDALPLCNSAKLTKTADAGGLTPGGSGQKLRKRLPATQELLPASGMTSGRKGRTYSQYMVDKALDKQPTPGVEKPKNVPPAAPPLSRKQAPILKPPNPNSINQRGRPDDVLARVHENMQAQNGIDLNALFENNKGCSRSFQNKNQGFRKYALGRGAKANENKHRNRVGPRQLRPEEALFRPLTEEERAKLLKQVDSMTEYAEQMERQERKEAMQRDLVREQCQRKMEETKERKCNRHYYKKEAMCIDQNHEMKLVDTVEKFFTCLACKWHNKVLHSKFPKACKKCGNTQFKAAGMVREKIAEIPKLLPRGEEHGKFLNSRPTGSGPAYEPLPDDVGTELK